MDNPFNPARVMVFIEAPNKLELIQKQVATNLLNQKMYNYTTPMKDGKKWVCWYFADVFNDKHIDGALKGFADANK